METKGQSVEALGSKIPDHPVKRHRRRALAEEDCTVELQKSVTKGCLDCRVDESATHTGQALLCIYIAQIQVTSAAILSLPSWTTFSQARLNIKAFPPSNLSVRYPAIATSDTLHHQKPFRARIGVLLSPDRPESCRA